MMFEFLAISYETLLFWAGGIGWVGAIGSAILGRYRHKDLIQTLGLLREENEKQREENRLLFNELRARQKKRELVSQGDA